MQVVDLDDPAFDELEDIIDINPLARTSIDEAHLPTPDQEIFAHELDSLTEDVEADVK